MPEYGGGLKRFRSPMHTASHTTAQLGLMRPALRAVLDVNVQGTDLLEDVAEPFILIGNHSSHFDGPLLMTCLPPRLSRRLATGAAADFFFNNPGSAAAAQLFMNAFPVNRGTTRSHRGVAKQLLSDGIPLLIFPEGTRSRNGGMGPFKPGVAALAISFNCQVVPAAIVGAAAAWPAGAKRWKPGRPSVHVTFGLPMRPRPGEIAHEFNERMRRKVIELHDSTAIAYGMPTQADMLTLAAIEKAKAEPPADPREEHEDS